MSRPPNAGSQHGERSIHVDLGERSYEVIVGSGLLGRIGEQMVGHRRVGVVSQSAVAVHHGEAVLSSLATSGIESSMFLMGDGEESKSLRTVEDLCSRFAAWGLLRSDAIVALGGGVVGDVAGFAAASYHRGVAFAQIPTTLLAQIDAAIGGKTGVNLPQGKNLVGAFHQPSVVLADTAALATLPVSEFRSGLGEVAKYLLMDPSWSRTSQFTSDISSVSGGLQGDSALLARWVAECASIKAGIVSLDETEQTGIRAQLNYGHTLAHALETLGAYDLRHGEAVAIGLVFAAELALALGRITPDSVIGHRSLLAELGLPTQVPNGLGSAELCEIMGRDKKAHGGLSFVLQGSIGVELVHDVNETVVLGALAKVGAV